MSLSLNNAGWRLVSSSQLRPPSPTNKAINLICCPSAGVQGHMNYNDRKFYEQLACRNVEDILFGVWLPVPHPQKVHPATFA